MNHNKSKQRNENENWEEFLKDPFMVFGSNSGAFPSPPSSLPPLDLHSPSRATHASSFSKSDISFSIPESLNPAFEESSSSEESYEHPNEKPFKNFSSLKRQKQILLLESKRGKNERLKHQLPLEPLVTNSVTWLQLKQAIKDENVNYFKTVLSKQCDNVNINEANAEGETLLHSAAEGGHTEIVQMLLEAGAAVDPLDEHACTPLLYAARESQTAVMEQLIAGGAELDRPQAATGDSYLHILCRDQLAASLRVLVAAGANTDVINDDGETVFDCCETQELRDIVSGKEAQQMQQAAEIEELRYTVAQLQSALQQKNDEIQALKSTISTLQEKLVDSRTDEKQSTQRAQEGASEG